MYHYSQRHVKREETMTKILSGVLIFSILSIVFGVGSATATSTTTPKPSTPTPTLTTTAMSTMPPGSCFFEGKVYANGEEVERDTLYNCYSMICDSGDVYAWDHQCAFYTPYCAGESERVLGQCCPVCNNITTTPPTTIPPTTTSPTTVPQMTTPPGSCVYNGEVFTNGQDIYRDSNNCGGALCQDGEVLHWDDECAFYTPVCNGISERVEGQCCPICKNVTTTPPTTIPPTTTPPTTTIPPVTTPPGSCFYSGKVYANGQEIYRDSNNCGGALCQDGGVMHWDDKCAFHTPVCYGISERVEGQCCPVCHNVTTTATPGCFVNGKLYSTGQDIYRDSNNCGGALCQDGEILQWDDECAFYTPVCNGISERVEGQCCPICKNVTTTPPTTIPPTTTPPTTTIPSVTTPPGSCFYSGKVYANGQEIYRDSNNCGGALCQDGGVMHWDDKCAFHTPVCYGISERVEGQCCPVCHNVTTTATPGCFVNGKLYSTGQRTNIDPCHVCLCTDNGTESCSNVTCRDVQDCDVKYRIAGECCYICGFSRDIANVFSILVLLFASRKLQIS